MTAAAARWIVRRPLVVWIGAALVFAMAAAVLSTREPFDTDILNLLPGDEPSVAGLKILNSEFAQSRELTFVIQGSDPDRTAEFSANFVEALQSEPWVVRMLDGPPTETVAGREDLQRLVIPLLFNLPADAFAEAVANLAPDRVSQRISELSQRAAAGSPSGSAQLAFDPLGLLEPVSRPLRDGAVLNQALDLVSADGRTVIIPVITNQRTLDAEDCRVLMDEVHRFIEIERAAWGEGAPSVGVTGRSTYVAEISQSMRRDILLTSAVSMLAVTGLFWFGFRRVLPLVGIIGILALSAFVALALGSLIFHQVNVIAIGFCSILFGLGDDFGLLLLEGYRHQRERGGDRESAIAAALREMGPGIFWVAVTTSIGFLALAFSGSAGFAQLGALVSIGIFVCAGLISVGLFLFVRDAGGEIGVPGSARPRPISRLGFAAFLIVLCGLTVVAVLPMRPLAFDTSPQSLEPKNTPAAQALSSLMAAFPEAFEPVIIVSTGSQSVDDALAQSVALDQRLAQLASEGWIEDVASPTSILLSPSRFAANLKSLSDSTLLIQPEQFDLMLDAAGLNPAAFETTREMVSALAGRDLEFVNWDGLLPSGSPWWFVIERLVTPDGMTTATFVNPIDQARGERLASALGDVSETSLVTGWTQTLLTLVPWAQRELAIYGTGVVIAVLVILAVVYRRPGFWVVHVLGLAFAAGATVACFKLAGAKINLLNVLAFPLMLAVGVDYGIHLILAVRKGPEFVPLVVKPVVISGLSTFAGFGALVLAENPALAGFGLVCATGVAWSLATALFFILPAARWIEARVADGQQAK